MELRHYLMIARRWVWLVLLAGLIAGGSAYLVTNRQTKLYRATALLFINQPQAASDPVSNVDVSSSQNLAPTYATMATSWPVLSKAAASMGLDPAKTSIQASASVPLNTQLLSLTVISPSRTFASDAANAASQALVDTVKETQLLDTAAVQRDLSGQLASVQSSIQKTTDELNGIGDTGNPATFGVDIGALRAQLTQQQQTFATLSGQLASLKIAQSKVDNGVHIVAPAREPASPFSPRPVFNALLATVLGLIAGAGLALMMEYLDDRVQTPHDVEAASGGAATLGIVERMSGGEAGVDNSLLLQLKHSSSRGLEAYRLLRSNVEFISADKPVRSIVVTSARPHEGKTTTAANLAIVLAQAGKRVLIVDADFRRPSLHRLFGTPNAAGLSTLFLQPDIPISTLSVQTSYENLSVLPTGPLPPNPAELISSGRMRPIIDGLMNAVDIVIFDSPPLLAVADAGELASRVDGTVIVVDSSRTRPRELSHARESLDRAGARVLGVALNKLRHGQSSRSEYYYYYYYSYGYQRRPDSHRSPSERWRRGLAGINAVLRPNSIDESPAEKQLEHPISRNGGSDAKD